MRRRIFIICGLLGLGVVAFFMGRPLAGRESYIPPQEFPTTRPAIGSRVTWPGVAENHKVGAWLAGPGIYVDLPGTHWPLEATGKTVEVQGTIVERRDLPVFIADLSEPPVAGIAVHSGTDLHKASGRLIVENVVWKAVNDGG